MQTEEQAAKEISYYLIHLADKQYKKVGDCFTLDTVFKSDRYLSLERRRTTCSRAVAVEYYLIIYSINFVRLELNSKGIISLPIAVAHAIIAYINEAPYVRVVVQFTIVVQNHREFLTGYTGHVRTTSIIVDAISTECTHNIKITAAGQLMENKFAFNVKQGQNLQRNMFQLSPL